MELLDAGNTGTYGHPVPTSVPLGAKKGKAILVSGHDLKDLEEVLKQTEGKGINVYTHGEMLPCHGYPELKKYSLLRPLRNGLAEPGQGVCRFSRRHCHDHQLYPETQGFLCRPTFSPPASWDGPASPISPTRISPRPSTKPWNGRFAENVPGKSVMVGFARNAVMGVADKVIEAVKNKAIKSFLPGGRLRRRQTGAKLLHRVCGKVPKDCVVLTLACGKFRFFDKDLGDIGGIPDSWTWASAMTPIRPSRSPWPWPMPLSAGSTTCRSP
jgi:hydroxylamine reductase